MIYKLSNQLYKNIDKKGKIIIKSFNKLNLLHKLFIITLILVLLFGIRYNLNSNIPNYRNIENFDNSGNLKKNMFEKKTNNIYDFNYAKHYDTIYLNTHRIKFEITKIISIDTNNKFTKILDVGCGTGEHVKLLFDKKLDITGLDKSQYMINEAKKKYPKCNYIVADITNSNNYNLDIESFTHILCLGKTIYELTKKEKDMFIENCFNLLNTGGYLIVNLVDREKFKPYVQNTNSDSKSKIVFNPENHGKNIDNIIVKFDKDNEFKSTFKRIDIKETKSDLNNKIPYAIYEDQFKNFANNNVKKYELHLYMPELFDINEMIKSKGFKLFNTIDLRPTRHTDEYLYIYIKDM